jgi:hypothetical protein
VERPFVAQSVKHVLQLVHHWNQLLQVGGDGFLGQLLANPRILVVVVHTTTTTILATIASFLAHWRHGLWNVAVKLLLVSRLG